MTDLSELFKEIKKWFRFKLNWILNPHKRWQVKKNKIFGLSKVTWMLLLIIIALLYLTFPAVQDNLGQNESLEKEEINATSKRTDELEESAVKEEEALESERSPQKEPAVDTRKYEFMFRPELDADLLGSGSFSIGAERYGYDQRLFFADTDVTKGDIVMKSNNEVPTFPEDLFQYQIEFDALTTRVTDGVLTDLDGVKLYLLGREMVITHAKIKLDSLELEFMTGDKAVILREGEETTFDYQGKTYTFEPVVFSQKGDGFAKLKLNGEAIPKMEVGKIDWVDEIPISIASMIPGKDADEGLLLMGASHVRFLDEDFTDAYPSKGLKIMGDTISNAEIKIMAVLEGDELTIKSIIYSYKLPDDFDFVLGAALSNLLDEPEAMLSEQWDIKRIK